MSNNKVKVIILSVLIILSALLANVAGETANWRGFWVSEFQLVFSALALCYLLRMPK